jgi:hypothetical protein
MTAPKKKSRSDSIRDIIRTIPEQELSYAKPSRVLPELEKTGIEITASIRSTVSKLLAEAKEGGNPKGIPGNIVEFPARGPSADRTEIAIKLVQACGGDCSLAKAEIDRLERIAKAVRDA